MCGIGGVIVVISVGTLLTTGIIAGLVLSWRTQAAVAALAGPFLYNMLAPVFWFTGTVTGLIGFVLLRSSNSKTRVPLLNVMSGLHFIHTAVIFVYGVQMVYKMHQVYLLHGDILAVAVEHGAKLLGVKDEPAKELRNKGFFQSLEQASEGMIFQMSPYPFNFIFFMGMRPDIAAVLWVVVPGLFSLFSLPFLMAIRNYFGSDIEGIKKHRRPYENVPLSEFICNGPAQGKPDDDGFQDAEEDLASTFDGMYSDEDEESEEESLLADTPPTRSIRRRN